ncbi:hypothetical protein RFI_30218, partial [Reticulomyxa filosa]
SGVDKPVETKTTVVKTTPLSSSSQFNVAENRPVAKYVQSKTPSRNYAQGKSKDYSMHQYDKENDSSMVADENSPLNKSFYINKNENNKWQSEHQKLKNADPGQQKNVGRQQIVVEAIKNDIEKVPVKKQQQHTIQTIHQPQPQSQPEQDTPRKLPEKNWLYETPSIISDEDIPLENSFKERTNNRTKHEQEPDKGIGRIRKGFTSPSEFHKLSPYSRRVEEAAYEHVIRSYAENLAPQRSRDAPASNPLEQITKQISVIGGNRTSTASSEAAEMETEIGRGREDIISSSEDRSSNDDHQKPRNQDTNQSFVSPIQPIKIIDLDDEPDVTTTQKDIQNVYQKIIKTENSANKDTISVPESGKTLQADKYPVAKEVIPAKADNIQLHHIPVSNETHTTETNPPAQISIQLPKPVTPPLEHIAGTGIIALGSATSSHNQIRKTRETADVSVPPKHHETVDKQSTINHPNNEQECKETWNHNPVNGTQEMEKSSTRMKPTTCTNKPTQFLAQRGSQDIQINVPINGKPLQPYQYSNVGGIVPGNVDSIKLFPFLGAIRTQVIAEIPSNPPLTQSPLQPVQLPMQIANRVTDEPNLSTTPLDTNQLGNKSADVPTPIQYHEPNIQQMESNIQQSEHNIQRMDTNFQQMQSNIQQMQSNIQQLKAYETDGRNPNEHNVMKIIDSGVVETNEPNETETKEPNEMETEEPNDNQENHGHNQSDYTQDDNASSDDTMDYNNRIVQQQEDLYGPDDEKEAAVFDTFAKDDIYDIDYDAVPDTKITVPKIDNPQWTDTCPVNECGAIFKTVAGLHIHVNKHISRNPDTVIPPAYFNIYKRISCLHCRIIISADYAVQGMHPKCSKAVKRQQPQITEIKIDFNGPNVDEELSQWTFPTPEEIAVYPARIITRIPQEARGHFASIASWVLLDISQNNSKESWAKWMTLIRTILWAPNRGGKTHHKQTTKVIMSRIKLWREQNFNQLWKDFLSHSANVYNASKSTIPAKPNTAAKNKRCIQYAAIGELSKAFKALSPSPSMIYDDQTIAALQKKHPDEPPPSDIIASFARNQNPDLPPLPLHKQITEEELIQYIQKLNRTSSGGIDLFTAQHLIDLMPYQAESNTLTHWAKVAQMVIEGKVCPEAQAIAYGARLIAIPKPDNTPRPIAIGSLFRRSAGAILLQRHSKEISSVLGPNQLGVNAKRGIETFFHGFKAVVKHIQRNKQGVAVKIDFQNAFNSCKRRKLLDLVRKRIPELYEYARGCYAKHVPLFLPSGHTIPSRSGVHQGDPLGGTFFAIILADALQFALATVPNLYHAAYHDDLTIAADDPDIVSRAVSALLATADSHGTRINLDKCEWIADESAPPPDRLIQIPHNKSFNTSIVGAPIGDDVHTTKEMDTILREWDHQFENLLNLKHAQTMLLLLRNSLNITKAAYHMKTNFAKGAYNWTNQFDNQVKRCAESIMACPLTNHQWLQCQTPIKRGGLGLNSANAHSSAAFITSALAAEQQLPLIHPHIRGVDWSSQDEIENAITHYNKNTKPQDNITDWTFAPSQSRLSKKINSRIQKELHNKRTDEQRILAKAISKPHASNYLNALPNKFRRTLLDNRELRALLRFRLGLKQTFKSQCQSNPACITPMDFLGNHALSCRFGKGRVARHDGIVACISNLLKRANIPHDLEVRANDTTHHRPGDICLKWFDDPFDEKCIDVGITHQHFTYSSTQTIIDNDKWALETYYRTKIRKHRLRCEQADKSYTPIIAETTGGWHSDAKQFFDKLAQVIAEKDNEDLDKTKTHVYNMLSIQLQKGNAQMLNSYCA